MTSSWCRVGEGDVEVCNSLTCLTDSHVIHQRCYCQSCTYLIVGILQWTFGLMLDTWSTFRHIYVTTLDERCYIHDITSSQAYVLDRCGRIHPRRLRKNYAIWPGWSSKVDRTVVNLLTAGQGEITSELTAVQYRRLFVGALV